MKYQKPKVVAKSAPKQSFVAGCPEKYQQYQTCAYLNAHCQLGPVN